MLADHVAQGWPGCEQLLPGSGRYRALGTETAASWRAQVWRPKHGDDLVGTTLLLLRSCVPGFLLLPIRLTPERLRGRDLTLLL